MLKKLVSKIVGWVLVVLAIFVPNYVLSSMDFRNLLSTEHTFTGRLLITLVTVVAIVAGVLAYYLINLKESKGMKIVGYAIIILVGFVPAILMMPYDRGSNALGTAYLTLAAVSIFSWSGLKIALKKD